VEVLAAEIRTAEQLAKMSEYGDYILAADINIPECWQPISIFGGTLDGAGHSVSGGGIFGVLRGAEIRNLTVENAVLHAKGDGNFGLLANEIIGGAFENVQITDGEIFAQGGVIGLFAGLVCGAEIVNCGAAGRINANGSALAGGFAGRLSGRSRVSNSAAYVNVTSGFAGGFVGEITNASRIEFSKSQGSVFGGGAAGGFAAVISADGAPNTITQSYALGSVVSGKTAHRFAAKTYHDGINGCYAALGMAVISGGVLAHVIPNPFGKDGSDISNIQLQAK
jgi:hypothetical protein